ncbi:hypothetical protein C0993_003272, partial [Termitomyces sp. T159_Od127]
MDILVYLINTIYLVINTINHLIVVPPSLPAINPLSSPSPPVPPSLPAINPLSSPSPPSTSHKHSSKPPPTVLYAHQPSSHALPAIRDIHRYSSPPSLLLVRHRFNSNIILYVDLQLRALWGLLTGLGRFYYPLAMGKIRGSGISRVVRVRNLSGPSNAWKYNYGLLAQQQEWELAKQRYEQSIQGLGLESLQILAKIQASASVTTDNTPDVMNDDFPGAWKDIPGPEDLVTHTARDIIDS